MTRQTCLRKYMKITVIILIFIILANGIYRKTRFYFYRPFFIPFGERLNTDNLILVSGETYTIHLQNINKRVSYSSTDYRVAMVLFTGKVFARKPGNAVITVSFDEKESKCFVKVIDINRNKKSIKLGERYKLRIKGTNSKVKWKSENARIVAVDEEGIITGQSIGIAVVSGSVHGKTMRCQVTVKENKKES